MNPMQKIVFSSALAAGLGISSHAMAADGDAVADQTLKVEEYKKTVIEKALFRYFNPLASLADHMNIPRNTTITYQVERGDTLSGIAAKFDVSLEDLLSYNRIRNPHLLSIGLELKIPPTDNVYVVESGDNPEKIAEKLHISVEELLEENPLLQAAGDAMYVGQRIMIPEKKNFAGSYALHSKKQVVAIASRKKSQSYPVPVMAWPVKGMVSSHYGTRWGSLHTGIDITNPNKGNTPINAARAGKVVKTEMNHGGYGYLVILDHGNNIQTYYAHLSKITVKTGDWVSEGGKLGYMGSTGNSTGYHLHFEIRYHDKPINPLNYLR